MTPSTRVFTNSMKRLDKEPREDVSLEALCRIGVSGPALIVSSQRVRKIAVHGACPFPYAAEKCHIADSDRLSTGYSLSSFQESVEEYSRSLRHSAIVADTFSSCTCSSLTEFGRDSINYKLRLELQPWRYKSERISVYSVNRRMQGCHNLVETADMPRGGTTLLRTTTPFEPSSVLLLPYQRPLAALAASDAVLLISCDHT